ncbi:muconolactone Delta-isomerase family protein [Rhodococcus sp. IEGM 1366]|uniref:muconolactone Delta-isomerase family protein n=1 Tax=Rhodococcus sp. IEGM 1366 TaxID=3082223 RepID=UPI00295562E9|nr:muconolactone Delta-isomerase family protein [Rhodococcus sp. IEGM 1366]MDV8070694.1 muconolactone Delta-isomerase family protein [Rhodococcus sp. IEGM 1366]
MTKTPEASSSQHEFLVEITTTIPDGTDPSEIYACRTAEALRAKELASAGRLVRLWRPVGELRSIGVWRADDEVDLYANVLGTLPMRPWMSIAVTPLRSHPNDPVQG